MKKAGHRSLPAIVLLWMVLILFPSLPCAREGSPLRLDVWVSREIKPYLQALEGIHRFSDADPNVMVGVHRLYETGATTDFQLEQATEGGENGTMIAIGPEATDLLWNESAVADRPKVYGMVLNPEEVIRKSGETCGISLRIPVAIQLGEIQKALPFIQRIGLLYNPAHNADFFRTGESAAAFLGLDIVALAISDRREIPAVLRKNWKGIDALWLIPDRTVISERLIEYIIKEAVLQKVPVIGYNRFFHDSGAVVSFVFDYERLGFQLAKIAVERCVTGICPDRIPAFETWINEEVARRLGLGVPAGAANRDKR